MRIKDLKQYFYKGRAIKYTFPGMYPVFYLTADGETLCADCITRNRKNVFRSTHSSVNDGWCVAGADANYEDNSMYWP